MELLLFKDLENLGLRIRAVRYPSGINGLSFVNFSVPASQKIYSLCRIFFRS